MTIHPMISALRKHKAGVVLIALQIALTLAIVCNAVFIIGQRIQRVNRPTGLNEQDLFLVSQQWVGAPAGDDADSIQKLDALQREDLATLRALPDVESVTPTNSLPLLNSSWNGSASINADAKLIGGNARTTYYFGDENFLRTLGLHLVAGRDFNAGDVINKGFRNTTEPGMILVTKALGDKLFPKGDALGKVIYLDGSGTPSTIIGEVERLQVPATGGWVSAFTWNATIEPVRLNANFSRYAVRARPGRLQAAMREVTPALYKANPMRVLDDDSVKSFADIRKEAYRADVGMAALMGVICLILLGVTAAGIVGLTSFWVGQRHRQIGVRRALGARKADILHYFQMENLLIAGIGAVAGVALAIGLNLLLMKHYEMDRMPVLYVLAGVAMVLALGQGAVFAPARRASNVPPVVATRAA
ncbi:FtsX-like permease family protein [Rhodanobacter sp. DHB23]|uniref:ABC transporter permease n=1 Tax=Rhodanobacter sp. DHB23 TaxID=2775923 RepID=UPI00178500CB|nr:FtsX-like permease family protein [Rhodanobacter sp. DHB23]MBD8871561.1 ABC transporter permease [Rhodanobacter sp. DHB23]